MGCRGGTAAQKGQLIVNQMDEDFGGAGLESNRRTPRQESWVQA